MEIQVDEQLNFEQIGGDIAREMTPKSKKKFGDVNFENNELSENE